MGSNILKYKLLSIEGLFVLILQLGHNADHWYHKKVQILMVIFRLGKHLY